MWESVLEPGLALLHGHRAHLRGFAQELAHHALHTSPRHVLWCDGDHGFDPYQFAELNLTRGHEADDGAQRLLVKRCMTPFQWDSVLTQHLPEKLQEVEASVVLVAPFDRLWSTDELADWEAEDYTQHALRTLKGLARRHRIPVVLAVDMARWWRTHPQLAQATFDAATARWTVSHPGGRWRAVRNDGLELDPFLRRNVTLLDFVEERPLEVLQLPRERPTNVPRPSTFRYRPAPIGPVRAA
jgi:hypothetical protein